MEKEKQILYDDENAARFVENIKGWVDINGRYFGNSKDSEHSARYSSCTHVKCGCGTAVRKGRRRCDECRDKKLKEDYEKLPFKEYNGDLVYSHLVDEYFRDSDEIEDYCFDNDINPKDLRLLFCEPNKFSEISGDYWAEVMPEDSDDELPTKLQEALDNLNKVISELPPASYSPGRIRTEFKSVCV